MREEEVSSPIQGVGGPRVLALSHERASGGSSVRRGGEYTCNAAEVGRGWAAAAAKAILYLYSVTQERLSQIIGFDELHLSRSRWRTRTRTSRTARWCAYCRVCRRHRHRRHRGGAEGRRAGLHIFATLQTTHLRCFSLQAALMAGNDWSGYRDVAVLSLVSIAPLATTLGYAEERTALAAGIFFAAALTKLTFNPSGPAQSYDKAAERTAIHAVVMTSGTNRAVRVCLGAVYAYASLAFALAMIRAEPENPRLLTRLEALEPRAAGELALTALGCLANCYFAGLWGSSGYTGQ